MPLSVPTSWSTSTSHDSQPTRFTIWTDICIVSVLCYCHVDLLLRRHMHANVGFEVYCGGEATHSCHSCRYFYYVQYGPLYLFSFVSVLVYVFVLVTRTTPRAQRAL